MNVKKVCYNERVDAIFQLGLEKLLLIKSRSFIRGIEGLGFSVIDYIRRRCLLVDRTIDSHKCS